MIDGRFHRLGWHVLQSELPQVESFRRTISRWITASSS